MSYCAHNAFAMSQVHYDGDGSMHGAHIRRFLWAHVHAPLTCLPVNYNHDATTYSWVQMFVRNQTESCVLIEKLRYYFAYLAQFVSPSYLDGVNGKFAQVLDTLDTQCAKDLAQHLLSTLHENLPSEHMNEGNRRAQALFTGALLQELGEQIETRRYLLQQESSNRMIEEFKRTLKFSGGPLDVSAPAEPDVTAIKANQQLSLVQTKLDMTQKDLSLKEKTIKHMVAQTNAFKQRAQKMTQNLRSQLAAKDRDVNARVHTLLSQKYARFRAEISHKIKARLEQQKAASEKVVAETKNKCSLDTMLAESAAKDMRSELDQLRKEIAELRRTAKRVHTKATESCMPDGDLPVKKRLKTSAFGEN